jgi:hypothetical protein
VGLLDNAHRALQGFVMPVLLTIEKKHVDLKLFSKNMALISFANRIFQRGALDIDIGNIEGRKGRCTWYRVGCGKGN